MTMNWIKRMFSGNQDARNLQKELSVSIDELSQIVMDNHNGVQKGLRRMSLAQQQQSEAIDMLAQESRSLKAAIADRHGVVLTYQQIMHILDHFDKIDIAVTHSEVLTPLVSRAIQDLLSLCELEAIAQVRCQYPVEGCEVVGAIEESYWPAGSVHQILQQGYRTMHGQIIRRAKVIVCREDKQHAISEQEEINNAN